MAVSKAQQKAVAKYMKENYDEIKVRVPKGKKAQIMEHIKPMGDTMSINKFIGMAIDEKIENDKKAVES